MPFFTIESKLIIILDYDQKICVFCEQNGLIAGRIRAALSISADLPLLIEASRLFHIFL